MFRDSNEAATAAVDWLEVTAFSGTILAAIAVCVTAVLVLRQVGLQSNSVLTEERRFLRESAHFVFEALQRDEFRSARERVLQFFKSQSKEVGKSQIDDFRLVLSTYEMLGLTLRLQAIDEKFWKGFWGRTLLRDWDRMKPFVDQERKQFGNPMLFEDAEYVVEQWRASFS